MSIRFKIKNTASVAEKEGDLIVRFTGSSEPFFRSCERSADKVGVDGGGNPKLVFNTGLNTEKVQFFKWYNSEEQKEIVKQIKELKPLIADYYGGEDVIDQHNKFFWGETREVNRLSLSNDSVDVFFDTKNPSHALLYLSIISGAFMDLVAPTKDWAENRQIPHYLAIETDEINNVDDDIITKSDAHAALAELRKEQGDALFILAWCLQYDTNAFGAYLRSTPLKDLINYHVNYIEGKLVTKRKKNMPKTFLEYAEKWKGQQTKPLLYVEAYIKAGEYYNLIQQKEKKYVTSEGTILGNTISEAVGNLMKPKFNQDLENLRSKIESKWKE
jgi:hypothetical protein